MAQAVTRRSHTAEARLQSHFRPSGICGGEIGTGTGYSPVLRFCCVNYHSTDTPHSLTCHVGDENGGQSRPQFHTDTFQLHHEHNNEYTSLIQRGKKLLTELLWYTSVLTSWAK